MAEPLGGMRVAIVGLGLMGGSLGQALGGFCGRRVGFDSDVGVAQRARSLGAVDEIAQTAEVAVRGADIVVIAVPVQSSIELIEAIAPTMQYGSLLTDLGSTKVEVVNAMTAHADGILVAGGHPMCGSDSGGIDRANGALYLGASWVVTPVGSGSESDAAVERTEAIARTAGAIPVRMDAAAHDRGVAFTSHLPYVLGGLLSRACAGAAADDAVIEHLAAGGFRDATRLAAGDPAVWRDILMTNREAIVAALDTLGGEMGALRELLEQGDADALSSWAARNREFRAPFLRSAR
jgi:prephenate dehydrogenase